MFGLNTKNRKTKWIAYAVAVVGLQSLAVAEIFNLETPAEDTVTITSPTTSNPTSASNPVSISNPVSATEVTTAVQNESAAPTKSELLRRQRMREELRNEDTLQTRLEELRINDEKKREEQIQGFGRVDSLGTQAPVQPVQMQPVQAQPSSPQVIERIIVTQAAPVAAEKLEAKEEEKYGNFGFQLRGGINQMIVDETYFRANGRFALGVALDIPVADVLGLEIGYQFSESGIGLSPNHPWYVGYNQTYSNNFNSSYNGMWESQTYSQNFFDALFKLLPLGQESRFRPFVGAGLGVSLGYLNYNRRMVDYLRSTNQGNLTTDYETTSMIGSVAAGVEYRISKQIVLGVSGKYSRVLTFNENYPFNYYTFMPWGPNGNPYLTNYGWDSEKANAGASLARSGFYSVLANLSFYF